MTVGRGWHRGATGRKDSRPISDSDWIREMIGIIGGDKSASGAGIKNGILIGGNGRGGD